MTMQTDLAIRKELVVRCSPEHAFRTFTQGIDDWWPIAVHSLGEERAVRAVCEAGVGGRLYEVWDDGSERTWGTIVAWEPPLRLAVSWKPSPEAAAATEWEVRFDPDGTDTRVVLEHRGWERLGEQASESYESYTSGWDVALRDLPAACDR
jgi:uncharacterized protein YndB with AHSA1/START domain